MTKKELLTFAEANSPCTAVCSLCIITTGCTQNLSPPVMPILISLSCFIRIIQEEMSYAGAKQLCYVEPVSLRLFGELNTRRGNDDSFGLQFTQT